MWGGEGVCVESGGEEGLAGRKRSGRRREVEERYVEGRGMRADCSAYERTSLGEPCLE